MKTKLTRLTLALALAITALNRVEGEESSTDSSAAASAKAEELNRRSIERRAVEAVIWGMPAVNYERMLQAAIANGAKLNQVVYWSKPVNWKNQTLTPNPDTIYLNPFYDTTAGPVVVEIPPADADHVIVGSFDVAWQNALADVGPAGADKGKGAKYLITPPGYEGKAPDGYIVLPSETYRGFVILRSNFKSRSDADVKSAVEHGKRVKVYPVGGNPDSTVFVDAYEKPFDATIPYDATFFDLLDRFVQAEPWLTRDKVMIDTLKTIGIEKGKPFKPDTKTKSILDKAVREAHEVIALKYEKGFVPPFFEGTHWAVPIPKETRDGLGSMFADPNEYGVDGRAVMYHMAYFSPKIFGGGQFYFLNIVDRTGKPLEGNKTYRLTVPPNAPVEQVPGRRRPTTARRTRSSKTCPARASRRTTRRYRRIRTDRRTSTSARQRRLARSPTGSRLTRSGSSNCCSDSTARRRNSSRWRGSCRIWRK